MNGFFEALTYNPQNPLLYNSVLFFVLFTSFYIFYVLAFNHVKTRNIFLLLFSLYFYYKVSGLFVIMLVLMSTTDYFIGIWIFYLRSNIKKRLLVGLSLIINIGYLSYFKYANFLIETFHVKGIPQHPFIEKILLPIGMSYFVFKSLTYIFDIYRELIDKPEHNYVNYLLYVSFFPNILAGPISKAKDLLPQINSKLIITNEHIGKGFFLIMTGAFKKIFISDFLAINFVDRVFDSPHLFGGFENLMAGYGAMIQIYCDFSGYTDIVIGIAFLLGFQISPNFNKPFLAQNITEFWRRWHLTLSRWMSDYLFYPLSYSFRRLKMAGAAIAVLITFFISGLWHGANLTFILWGCSHGLAIAYDVLTKNIRYKISKKINPAIYKFISIFITLNFLSLSIILFRSANLGKAIEMYHIIFTKFNTGIIFNWISVYRYPLIVMIFAYILHYLPQQWNDALTSQFIKLHWSLKAVVVFVAIILIYQTFNYESLPFVYLEF